MNTPTSLDDIERLIRDQTQESIHLEYKQSRALNLKARDEITKDVSAFANSDGGLLIYGVQEKENFPVAIDEGVKDSEIHREWLESAIMTGISPRLEDVRIIPIVRSEGRSLFIVDVKKSFSGPHQSSKKVYYKRHNFKSVPMEHYEVEDIRNRRRQRSQLVVFECGFYRDFVAFFDVANIGNIPAYDLKFEFSPEPKWPDSRSMPAGLAKGMRSLAPKQRIRYRYFQTNQLLAPDSQHVASFTATVSYFHPELGHRVQDEWPIDFEAYQDSMHVRSEMEYEAKETVKALKEIKQSLDKLREVVEPLNGIASNTGLRISHSTLRNVKAVESGGEPDKIDPHYLEPRDYSELLGVDSEMAFMLFNKLTYNHHPESLSALPGMTDDLKSKIAKTFILKWDDDAVVNGSTMN